MAYRIVEIVWGDAFIDTDDFTAKEARKTKPVKRSTVGYLVAKNQHGYTLATDKYAKKGEYAAKMFIPHGMVEKIICLEAVET